MANVKSVIDMMREPVLVLDENFVVIFANEPFYKRFSTHSEHIINQSLFEVRNGEWNIPSLKTLLQKSLPEKMFLKDLEVSHDFGSIGKKTLILNAKEIPRTDKQKNGFIVLLAIEDVTDMVDIADMLSRHVCV